MFQTDHQFETKIELNATNSNRILKIDLRAPIIKIMDLSCDSFDFGCLQKNMPLKKIPNDAKVQVIAYDERSSSVTIFDGETEKQVND